jgi:serine/threonine-protein kinase
MHSEDTPDPLKYAPDLPDELVVILMKVLSKAPSARYRTADQLGHILANLLEKRSITRATTPPPHPQTQAENLVFAKHPSTPPAITQEDYSSPPRQTVDWKLIWLELLTLLLVGGLIPFWLFIWFKLSMLIR